jgi:hypothetical protein
VPAPPLIVPAGILVALCYGTVGTSLVIAALSAPAVITHTALGHINWAVSG